jgi:hypothetical protein
MKVWRVVVVVALALSAVVILLTAYLEAEGRIRLPWPMMAPQVETRFGPIGTHRLAVAGPYVEAIAGLVLQYLVGVFVLYAIPERMRRLTDAVAAGGRDIVRFLAIGLLLVLTLGAVALLSAFYIHTALLPFLLAGILFVAALVGTVALAVALGRALLRRAAWAIGSPLVALLVGTTLLFAATRVPYLAPVVMGLLGVIGSGAALSTRFGGRRTWTLDPLREGSEA